MRSNSHLKDSASPKGRAKESFPFGLTSTLESYPLVADEDSVGEVRFLRNPRGDLKRIEILHKGESDRIGIPAGFSIEHSGSITQAEFENLLRPKGGVLFTLHQVVNALESYPFPPSQEQKEGLVRRHSAAWLKEARRCDVNESEFLQYYRDCLPASLVDWAAGCRRTESQILRQTGLGLTTIECQLVTSQFPQGDLIVDIRVFKYDTGSSFPELVACNQGVSRRRHESELLINRISEVIALFELSDCSKLLPEVQEQVGGMFNYSHPSLLSGAADSKRTIQMSSGGLIREEKNGGEVSFSLYSGLHENASKIQFEGNRDGSLLDKIFDKPAELSESVIDKVEGAFSSGQLVSTLLHTNPENSSRLVHISENLTTGFKFLQPCGLPPHIFTIPELARTFADGCDWIGYSDIRFGPNLPLHGARFAHSIFFKVWEGGCQQILLQLPGDGVITISPPPSPFSSKQGVFIQGGLSDLRCYLRNQLHLFTFDPLSLLRFHLMSKSEVYGEDPRILNERAVSQLQFLGNMLLIDAQRSERDRLFPTREIHPLTLYVRSSGELCTVTLNTVGPFAIQIALTGQGLRRVEVRGRSSFARRFMTKQEERVFATTGVPEQIGKCADRSYELLRSLWEITASQVHSRQSRPPTRNCIWKLIDNQLQEDM